MDYGSLSSSSEDMIFDPPPRPKTTGGQRRTALGAVNRNIRQFAPKKQIERRLNYHDLSSIEPDVAPIDSPETIQKEFTRMSASHQPDEDRVTDEPSDTSNNDDNLLLIVDQQQARISELLIVLKEASENIRKEREAKELLQQKIAKLKQDSKKSNAIAESYASLQSENEELLKQLRAFQADPQAELSEQKEMLQTELYLQGSINQEQDIEIRNLKQKVESMREEIRILETKCGTQEELLRKKDRDRQKYITTTSPDTEAEQLLNRVHRACAPPPDPEMIGQLVDIMVSELRRAWLEQFDINLHLVKVGRSRYRFGDRMLHLQVQNNKLVYRSGAGHKDLVKLVEEHQQKAQKSLT
eukprot:TRINITY_DN15780_c0_g1_i1.p1 TRINITY_DN15780_c0_g1~~TRINITY_DN15780_c0_g1_i1.p1  ORF type:complete len:356 (+),score=79.55 TRINITY_DN15780_c0_g1_i1:250-1317(+)